MSRKGWVLFALVGLLWGVPYLFMKVAVEELSTPVIVFARLAIGALLRFGSALGFNSSNLGHTICSSQR